MPAQKKNVGTSPVTKAKKATAKKKSYAAKKVAAKKVSPEKVDELIDQSPDDWVSVRAPFSPLDVSCERAIAERDALRAIALELVDRYNDFVENEARPVPTRVAHQRMSYIKDMREKILNGPK